MAQRFGQFIPGEIVEVAPFGSDSICGRWIRARVLSREDFGGFVSSVSVPVELIASHSFSADRMTVAKLGSSIRSAA